MGALSITGLPGIKADFEPLVPSGVRVPNTNLYRAPAGTAGADGTDAVAFGRWAADRIEEAILFEGPDTVAAVFLEPVQNSGGCFPPPPGYFERVREICDAYDVLLVSDGRSEERRVGKECRSRWSLYHSKKKINEWSDV